MRRLLDPAAVPPWSVLQAEFAALRPADAVDLHLHTLASDGFWTPEALIDHLAAHDFRVAAVCDHDTQRSVAETVERGAARGIRVIPGVEVTTRWADRQIHLLVYGIAPERDDPDAAPFQAVLHDLDVELQRLAEDARQRLEASGRSLPALSGILAGRVQWPFHVLSAAIADGHGKDLKEVAELVRQLGGDFSADQPLERVVAAAHQAGGLCLIAHPGRGDSVGIIAEADLMAILAEVPIDGLEAHYRSYTDAQTAEYRAMAERHGLLISCGSDSHALGKPVDPRPWRAAWCAALLARLGLPVAPLPATVWAPGMDPLAAVATPEAQTDPPAEQLLDAEAEAEPAARP